MSDKKQRLMELDVHRRKLSHLIGELLRRADELDQESKNDHNTHNASLSRHWHEQLATTCSDLAALSQAVDGVDALLKSNKIESAEETILRCVKIANHLSRRLNELKSPIM